MSNLPDESTCITSSILTDSRYANKIVISQETQFFRARVTELTQTNTGRRSSNHYVGQFTGRTDWVGSYEASHVILSFVVYTRVRWVKLAMVQTLLKFDAQPEPLNRDREGARTSY